MRVRMSDKQAEEWKEVDGFEGLYEVSNFGRVKSVSRYVKNGLTEKKINEKILVCSREKKTGYLRVTLCKNGKQKIVKVHRLVAFAFLPNLNNYPQVNHKDEDKSNNRVDNLEWCTAKYNMNYGKRNERAAKSNTNGTRSRPVIQIKDGNIIAEFPSASEVERALGFGQRNISSCCRGKYKQAYGYEWKYKQPISA